MTHHGEYKTPGGKLVAVRLAVLDGRTADVRVSGDFFLSPEPQARPTLDAITQALNGMPTDSTLEALAARVRTAIPFGVELLGTSPDAIAEAVRRAGGVSPLIPHESATPDGSGGLRPPLASNSEGRIGSLTPAEVDAVTAGWSALGWRLLPERPLSAPLNVALDEVLTDRVASGECPPTLRFWRWSEPAVIVGRCQAISNEVDRAAAAEMGVRVVRRMTGGGAMFLQPHGAVTYSLYLPESAVAGLSIRLSYEVCEAWVVRGLRELGVDAHHVPINDIACSDGKIGGAAQARRRGVVLHHTTLAYDMNPGEMLRVLRIGREKLKDKAVSSAAKRVSPLARQTQRPRDEIAAHLFDSFRRRFGGTTDALTAAELAAADALVAAKYANPEWTDQFE